MIKLAPNTCSARVVAQLLVVTLVMTLVTALVIARVIILAMLHVRLLGIMLQSHLH